MERSLPVAGVVGVGEDVPGGGVVLAGKVPVMKHFVCKYMSKTQGAYRR